MSENTGLNVPYSKSCSVCLILRNILTQVPVGTQVKSAEGVLLQDLNKSGDLFVAARGGAGL